MFDVVPVTPSDLDAVAALMVEMDAFYAEPDLEEPSTKVRHMEDTLFSNPPSAYLLIVRDDSSPTAVGFAAYSFLWPAVGTTRSLYLKELYVRKGRRREGIARLLMQQLFRIASESGCSRVEWTTDRANVEAQEFYTAIGTASNPDKLFFRQEVL